MQTNDRLGGFRDVVCCDGVGVKNLHRKGASRTVNTGALLKNLLNLSALIVALATMTLIRELRRSKSRNSPSRMSVLMERS